MSYADRNVTDKLVGKLGHCVEQDAIKKTRRFVALINFPQGKAKQNNKANS